MPRQETSTRQTVPILSLLTQPVRLRWGTWALTSLVATFACYSADAATDVNVNVDNVGMTVEHHAKTHTLFATHLLASTESMPSGSEPSQSEPNQSVPSHPWPNGAKAAISLSYDDALTSQLDTALPTLNRYGFHASFYLTLSSNNIALHLTDWRQAASQGHELGNHSLFHSCRKSLPNREWVSDDTNLDNYSVAQMIQELKTANQFLMAIDGKTERTFTIPCGDTLAGGKDFITKASALFVAVKGQGVADGSESLWAPTDVSGQALIDYIEQHAQHGQVINLLFHGVGGDYLSVSREAHEQLLAYLAQHKADYWVDTYLNIMSYRQQQLSQP